MTVAPSSSASPSRQRCVVAISRGGFRVIWALAMALHVAGAAFHVAVLRLHRYLQRDGLSDFLVYLGDDLYRFFPTILALNALFAALHSLTLVGTLVSSVYHRELTFHFTSRMALASPQDALLSSPPSPSERHSQRRPSLLRVHVPERWLESFQSRSRRVTSSFHVWRSWRWLRRLYRVTSLTLFLLFSRRGVFGMESPYFAEVFALREAVEIVFQTYQALRLSRHVSTVWINRLLSLVIVANCWATPIVRSLFRRDRQESQRRLACLVLDLALDVTSVFVIPLTVFWPYARAFRTDYLDFPFLCYYDDTWFIRAVAENQQLFATSAFDLVTKALPWLTLLSTLRSIKATFRLRPDGCDGDSKPPQLASVVPAKTVAPPPPPVAPPPPNVPAHAHTRSRRHTHARLHRVVDVLMVLWGVAVGALHFHASAVAVLVHTNTGCLLEVRPWFSGDYSCVVLEVHCDAWRARGVRDLESVLAPLASARLRSLIFSSCRDLEMPPRLQRFPELQVLKLFNTTLRAWDAAAALTADAHPSLQLLYLVDVNMTEIPVGLRAEPFPPTLQDIEFCGTNLSVLPLELASIWGGAERYLDYLVLENVYGRELRAVPPLLETLRVRHLSLCATGLEALPASFFWRNASLQLLDVSSNPRLATIPERHDVLDAAAVAVAASEDSDAEHVRESRRTPLWELHVEFTAVATLPEWVAVAEPDSADWSGTQLVVYAERSPLCGVAAAALPVLSPAVAINCDSLPADATQRLLYPVDAELAWRAASAARWYQQQQQQQQQH